jgi:hypothetical protein
VRRPVPGLTGGHESGGCATLGQRKLRPGSGSPRSQVGHFAEERGRATEIFNDHRALRDEQLWRTAQARAHQSIFEVIARKVSEGSRLAQLRNALDAVGDRRADGVPPTRTIVMNPILGPS